MEKPELRLLYLTAEPWPTFRPDVQALFGKYLPRLGVHADLLTECDPQPAPQPWGGGAALLFPVPRSRAAQYAVKLWRSAGGLLGADAQRYAAIQVRDMSVTALLGLLVARAKGLPFIYWLSYPQSEGQLDRARQRGPRAGMKYWFPLLQGALGKFLLYRIVLPRAAHVFVQSHQMQLDVAQHGIALDKMTPVPMAVDTELARPDLIVPSDDPRLQGRRVVAYLGTMDPLRRIDVLFEMVRLVRQQLPEVLLVLAGDTEDLAHRSWLRQEIERLGIGQQVLWLGWKPAAEAWRYVRAAEIGLSPFPRSWLLDSASPTKAVEYMALGLPVVVNDNPDQRQAIEESGAGVCVDLSGDGFAGAVLDLLADPSRRHVMGERGRAYVARQRDYAQTARMVATVYHRLLGATPLARAA